MRAGLLVVMIACVAGCGRPQPRVAAGPAHPLAGRWEGTFDRDGVALPVAIELTADGGSITGTFTSLEQRTMEYPFDAPVRVQADKIHFEIGDGSLVLDGERHGGSIRGTLREGEAPATFTLARAAPAAYPYRRKDVTFVSGGAALAGSLFIPGHERASRRVPAVVFLHGSGPEIRWGTARYWADQVARAGFAALIFDKRGSGGSAGDWKQASYEDLADDALAGVRLLAAEAEVDAARIGFYGHSQGGAVAPLAATRGRPGEVAFLIAAGTFAGPQWRQDIYRVEGAIARETWSAEDKAAARALYALFVDVARGQKTHDELERAIATVKDARWLEWIGIPPRDHWLWRQYAKTGNFDTLPVWEKVAVPVLLIYGARDELVPPGESIAFIKAALGRGANPPVVSMLIPRAAHNLTVRPDPGQPFDWWQAAPGLSSSIIHWLQVTTSRTPP